LSNRNSLAASWSLPPISATRLIGPDFQPDAPSPEPTHLVVYRTRGDDVEFMQINTVTQRLLQLLRENPRWTGRQAVTRIVDELHHPRREMVLEAGRQLLGDLRARNVILGARRSAH
jgi:hypothetical protein